MKGTFGADDNKVSRDRPADVVDVEDLRVTAGVRSRGRHSCTLWEGGLVEQRWSSMASAAVLILFVGSFYSYPGKPTPPLPPSCDLATLAWHDVAMVKMLASCPWCPSVMYPPFPVCLPKTPLPLTTDATAGKTDRVNMSELTPAVELHYCRSCCTRGALDTNYSLFSLGRAVIFNQFLPRALSWTRHYLTVLTPVEPRPAVWVCP